MNILAVTIERLVDDEFPSFVECVLVDSDDCSHRFVEKAPVVSMANLSFESVFPQPGHVACVIEDEWSDERGRQLVRVCASDTTFTVLRSQIQRM